MPRGEAGTASSRGKSTMGPLYFYHGLLGRGLCFAGFDAVELESFLQGADGDLQLIVRRFLRCDALECQARKNHQSEKALFTARRREAYQLVRQSRNNGDQHQTRKEYCPKRTKFKNREHDDAHDHYKQQETGAATRVKGRFAACVFHRQRFPGFPGVYHLVLRSVILEYAADILHEAYQDDVGQEENDANQAVNQVENNPIMHGRDITAQPACNPKRQQNKEEYSRANAQNHGKDNRKDGAILSQLSSAFPCRRIPDQPLKR